VNEEDYQNQIKLKRNWFYNAFYGILFNMW